jgi:6-phosphogluconate dehydrogenase (decarboxylating)
MATSQCVKCGNSVFELVAKFPVGSSRKIMFVQCSVCGGVVGIQEEHSQNVKGNPRRIEEIQEPVRSSFKTQATVDSDIESLIKYLYG